MSSDFFRVERGLEISDSAGEPLVQIITNASPPNTQADAIAAPIGSIWLINGGSSATTRVYQKFQQVTSDHFDWRDVTSTTSWREPARVADTTTWATVAAAETQLNSGNPNTLGGVLVDSFVNGDRILFTDFTTGNENVYIVNGTPGTATLVEDNNAATNGDALYIQEGTSAGLLYVFNGTVWLTGASAAEEGFIRAFIGKDAAGSETPNYTNPTGGGPFTLGNIIGNTDNLELALAKVNSYLYENQAKTTVTNATTASDTLPTGKNMAMWMVRVNDHADPTRVRARLVFAIRDSANLVDFSAFSLLSKGNNVANLNFDVTSTGSALTLTITTTGAADFEIHRIAVF